MRFSNLSNWFRSISRNPRLRRIWAEIESTLVPIFLAVLYSLVAVGIVAYFLRYISALVTREPTPSPLQLATVAAALGGLILIGAFYKEKSPIEPELKRIAKLFLGAAVSFIIVFLLLQAVSMIKSPTLGWAEWLLVVMTGISITAAGITLCLALIFLIRVIRHL